MLDYLDESDTWTQWSSRNMNAKLEDLRAEVDRWAAENEGERLTDPEWNIGSAETVRLLRAFLEDTPYQQWLVVGAPQETAREQFEDCLWGMALGDTSDWVDVKGFFEYAARVWYDRWVQQNQVQGYMVGVDGVITPTTPNGVKFLPYEIQNRLGRNYSTQTFKDGDQELVVCSESSGVFNEEASRISGLEVYGEALIVGPK